MSARFAVALFVALAAAAAPAAQVTLNPVQDSMVDWQATAFWGDSSTLRVGYWDHPTITNRKYRSYLQFDLSSIPPGATINAAWLDLVCLGVQQYGGSWDSDNAEIGVHLLTAPLYTERNLWPPDSAFPSGHTYTFANDTSNLRASNMPPYNPTALDTVSCYGPNGVYTDRLGGTYQRYFYSLHLHHNVSTYQTPVGIYTSWNVTGAVQDWVSGVKPNYGLLLKERDEDQSTQVSYVTFASSEYVHVHNASYLPCPTGEDGQAFPPRLVVDYTLPLSGADIWQTTDIVLDRDIWTRGSQKFPTDNNMRNGLHPTLGDNLMYLHADMSVLPPNAVVDSAQLNLFYYGLGGPSVSVAAFRLTADWVENLSTGIPAHDPTEIDLSQGSGVDADGFAVGMYYFVWDRFYNMTGVVQDWLNGQPNYGVLLQDTPANTTQSKYSYLAHEHPQVNYRPKFTVTWNCGACQSIIDEVSELTCNLPPTTNIAEAQAAVASAIAQAQSDVDYDCTDCVEAFMDQLVLTLLAE